MMNPQVRYGEDLMSRISYGMMHPDGAERLHKAIVELRTSLSNKPRDRLPSHRKTSSIWFWWATA